MPRPVLVIDDHRTFADLMRLALDAQSDLHCAGVAHSVDEGLRAAAAIPCTAAIVDLGLPDGDGTQVVAALRRRTPDARIVVLTAHPRSDLARRALAAGADRVLPKRGRLDEVLLAVREDRRHTPPPSEDVLLTPREREVLSLLAEGLHAQDIAARLSLSLFTVRDHIRSLLAKLDASSQLEAVVAAARAGIIVLEPR